MVKGKSFIFKGFRSSERKEIRNLSGIDNEFLRNPRQNVSFVVEI